MAKYLKHDAGIVREVETGATGGATDANKIPSLNAAGQLTEAMMPTGVGRDVNTYTASEALAAGAIVNIWDDAGTIKIRNADASTNKPAHGFVSQAVTSGAVAEVYAEGTNASVSGLSSVDIYLSGTAGQVTGTIPTTSGHLVQKVGVYASASSFNFERGTVIRLA